MKTAIKGFPVLVMLLGLWAASSKCVYGLLTQDPGGVFLAIMIPLMFVGVVIMVYFLSEMLGIGVEAFIAAVRKDKTRTGGRS